MKKLLSLTLLSTIVFAGCLKQEASITVIDQDKAAVEGAAITIEAENGERQSHQSNKQGMIHSKLKKGAYKVSINKRDCEAKYEEVSIQVSKTDSDFVTELICN